MNQDRDRLPSVYATFLTLRDEELEDIDIANRLGVPVESLTLMARLAEAKSARLAGQTGSEDVGSTKADELGTGEKAREAPG